jgi:hypothetical protein
MYEPVDDESSDDCHSPVAPPVPLLPLPVPAQALVKRGAVTYEKLVENHASDDEADQFDVGGVPGMTRLHITVQAGYMLRT